MNSILIKNASLVTLGEKNQVLNNYCLYIKDGKIEQIAALIDKKADKVIDAGKRLVMPGFINAHMHYYSSFARGLNKAAPSKNFVEILKNLWWRLDKKLSLEDCYYSTLLANIEAIKKGTTTLLDHHASPLAIVGSLNQVAKAVKDSGLRASLCYELSDRDGERTIEQGIKENVDFIERCAAQSDQQLRAMFGLHASFTLSDQTLKKAVDLAQKYGAGFHVHTAEDKADQRQTIARDGLKVVERFFNLGILGSKTICAHCVHVDESELELIKKTDTMVVHNPQSNMNNAVGVADIFKMLDRGILVGLGTDAMTVNMLEELRSALWVHKLTSQDPGAGFMECCQLLLENNAKIANRFWQGLGELKIGNLADVIISDYRPYTPLSADNFLGHLVFGISQSSIDTTIASGKVLMENKKTIFDEESISQEAQKLSAKLWGRF